MNKVHAVFEQTVKLLETLEKNPGMDRDKKVTLINEFLENREKEIKHLSPPYTAEEIELGKRLVKVNTKLDQRLHREKLLIQKDIQILHTKKASSQKYTNPYENFSTSGVFYDKRN